MINSAIIKYCIHKYSNNYELGAVIRFISELTAENKNISDQEIINTIKGIKFGI